MSAALKHALCQDSVALVFAGAWSPQDEKKRPWRISGGKLGAAFRKEARSRRDQRAEVAAGAGNLYSALLRSFLHRCLCSVFVGSQVSLTPVGRNPS